MVTISYAYTKFPLLILTLSNASTKLPQQDVFIGIDALSDFLKAYKIDRIKVMLKDHTYHGILIDQLCRSSLQHIGVVLLDRNPVPDMDLIPLLQQTKIELAVESGAKSLNECPFFRALARVEFAPRVIKWRCLDAFSITSANYATLATKCPNLVKADLFVGVDSLYNAKGLSFGPIFTLTRLTFLHLCYTHLSDKGASNSLATLTLLEKLKITYEDGNLGPLTFASVSKLPRLRCLKMRNVDVTKPNECARLLLQCTKLEHLSESCDDDDDDDNDMACTISRPLLCHLVNALEYGQPIPPLSLVINPILSSENEALDLLEALMVNVGKSNLQRISYGWSRPWYYDTLDCEQCRDEIEESEYGRQLGVEAVGPLVAAANLGQVDSSGHENAPVAVRGEARRRKQSLQPRVCREVEQALRCAAASVFPDARLCWCDGAVLESHVEGVALRPS